MKSLPHVATRIREAPLAAILLSVALTTPAAGAEVSATDSLQPVEELVELDEVKVRGRLVRNAVIRTEDLVFRLYNRLNRDNRYDVQCGDLPRTGDSLILRRVCLPEFLGDYANPFRLGPASFGSRAIFDTTPRCGGGNSGVAANGNMFSFASCPTNLRTSLHTPLAYTSSADSPAVASPAAAISAEKRAEFVQHMSRVLNSDPELKAMAAELADMYREVDRVQAQFVKLLAERRAAQSAKMAAARERARERGRSLRPPHPREM
jgi:hypothetical protein